MPQLKSKKSAFGAPGAEAHWSHANKDGVGTAYDLESRIWFTIWNGILTEIHYPTIDRPQVRDVQFLFVDEEGQFIDEKCDMHHETERMTPSQGYRITSRERNNKFSLVKEVITDPRRASVLIHAELKGQEEYLNGLRVYLLCNPHLNVAGENNNARVAEVSGTEILVAQKDDRWMVAGATCRFSKLSCGYVGSSDGYTDLQANHAMTWEFDQALDGNVALTAQLDVKGDRQFTVAISFGETLSSATACLLQSLSSDFKTQRGNFVASWKDAGRHRKSLEGASRDKGRLFHSSYNIVLAHEDKTYQGAFIASVANPWGEARNDKEGKGGYHLVWTRDMVQSAMGLLAAGDADAPARVLVYLAARQDEDGSFPQNFWVNGKAFWKGEQLDEVAFPVLLAWRLHREKSLARFDARTLVRRAVNFLLISGPVTGEERWEEASGYSPSTLAVIVAAFICAAGFEDEDGKRDIAAFLESYADFVMAHIEEWTVCSKGYFVRLNPAKPGEVAEPGDVDKANLTLTSQPPGSPDSFPASEIVDAGFLQLVRYGVLAADDPIVLKSVDAVDEKLRIELPGGLSWRRYNHDGYGQRPDGGPYKKWGEGRCWPLLTGERAHYELAAGGDYQSLVHAMETFGAANGLLPEQLWDADDLPEANMYRGKASGSASPLVWAHSEYLRLLRSSQDKAVFDLIPEVERRYLKEKPKSKFEFWMPKHPIRFARENCILRVCAPEKFRLRWSTDSWATSQDTDSSATGIGAEFCDLSESAIAAGVEFTFFWTSRDAWEGRNHRVEVSHE
jgi:glucoamylase